MGQSFHSDYHREGKQLVQINIVPSDVVIQTLFEEICKNILLLLQMFSLPYQKVMAFLESSTTPFNACMPGSLCVHLLE